MARKGKSTPSWLLPSAIRRFRALLGDIQRTAHETQQQVLASHQQAIELLSSLDRRVNELAELVEEQRIELSRIESMVARGAGREGPTTRRWSAARSGQAVVLAYHHVAEPAVDPLELSVTPHQFEQHLELLSGLGHVVPIEELGNRIAEYPPGDALFALTFDDGYADNLHTVKPILERHCAPATVFLATGLLGGTSFWWDQIAQLVLESERSARRISVTVDGVPYRWGLDNGNRQLVFWELHRLLRSLEHGQRLEILAEVCSQLGGQPAAHDRSLFAEEIGELAEGGVVKLGAHTVTHPLLTRTADDVALTEIAGSRQWIEDRLDRPVTAFAYPYGDFGQREVDLVRQARFGIAFATGGAPVRTGCDPLAIPRVVVGHWDATDLERKLTELQGG